MSEQANVVTGSSVSDAQPQANTDQQTQKSLTARRLLIPPLSGIAAGYAIDGEATIGDDGTWTASDSDLGNPGQRLPFPLTARVIAANPQCARGLQAAMNSNQDYITSLPGGCEIGPTVMVEVTRR
jgi:hypothetical protein